MLQKSQCDLPRVKLPQAFLLQGRVSWTDLSFYCEFLSTSFFFFKHTHTETCRHICLYNVLATHSEEDIHVTC